MIEGDYSNERKRESIYHFTIELLKISASTL